MSTDNNYPTPTSEEQHEVEMNVLRYFGATLNKPDFDMNRDIILHKNLHVKFLTRGLLEPLKPSYISLEASRPWIVFWILHALDLLGEEELIDMKFSKSVPHFLEQCQNHHSGGFGGGPGQISHLATTYAAVAALVTIGTREALGIIDRRAMKKFLLSMKDPITGAFRMHDDGEVDIRGTYCAIAVASLLRLIDHDLVTGVGEYVGACQTYEGGIAGEPGMEAHGGYSYCGLAALAILGIAQEHLDLKKFEDWLCRRQMCYEGGFQGRANKLVDSCYTFWQGACFPLLIEIDRFSGVSNSSPVLFNQGPAQLYVLLACQSVYDSVDAPSESGEMCGGGLRDKPGKNPDFYHSCYALSGLAALQYPSNCEDSKFVLGNSENELTRNCVFYNCCLKRVYMAREYMDTIDEKNLGQEGPGITAVYSRNS